jgi:hypothetical protein
MIKIFLWIFLGFNYYGLQLEIPDKFSYDQPYSFPWEYENSPYVFNNKEEICQPLVNNINPFLMTHQSHWKAEENLNLTIPKKKKFPKYRNNNSSSTIGICVFLFWIINLLGIETASID